MFTTLRTILSRWIAPSVPTEPAVRRVSGESQVFGMESLEDREAIHVPYNEKLLEQARTQWQFCEWDSPAELQREQFEHHPERGKLALLAAAGLISGLDQRAVRVGARNPSEGDDTFLSSFPLCSRKALRLLDNRKLP